MSMCSGNGPEFVTFKDGGSDNPSQEAYYDIAKSTALVRIWDPLSVSELVLSR